MTSCDDVVFSFLLDLVDALDVPLAALPDGLRGFGRNDAELGLSVAGMRFDLEPDPVTVVRLPNGGHGGAGVTRNHRWRSLKGKRSKRQKIAQGMYRTRPSRAQTVPVAQRHFSR
jgi:hypothetical protein